MKGSGKSSGRRSKGLDDFKRRIETRFHGASDGSMPGVDELVAVCLKHLTEGLSLGDIMEILNKDYKNKIDRRFNREDPYAFIRYAAATGRLSLTPKSLDALRDALQKRLHPRARVEVVASPANPHVAKRAAQLLHEWLQDHLREHREKREIHLGFAGGNLLRMLAQELAILLADSSQPTTLPSNLTLYFHAMVGGFNAANSSNPNAFTTYLTDDGGHLRVRTGFVGLHAPAIVTGAQWDQLRQMDAIRDALEQGKKLDVVVTSAGRWSCHSVLMSMLSEKTRNLLKEQECRGDILWSPLGDAGALEFPGEQRAVTLMNLRELSEFVNSGKRAMLVLGPCGACQQPKVDVLNALIKAKQTYFTDYIVDSETARRVCFPEWVEG